MIGTLLYVADSIPPGIEPNMEYLNNMSNESWFSWSLSLGEALTIICVIISVWIAIKQFNKSMNETRKLSVITQKETWFLNVIVLPQLEPINDFYKELLNDFEIKKRTIQDISQKLQHQQYLLELAIIKQGGTQSINNFFDQICALVKSYDIQLGATIEGVVMELEDLFVKIIDSYDSGTEINERALILDNKQKLINTLNKGIAK